MPLADEVVTFQWIVGVAGVLLMLLISGWWAALSRRMNNHSERLAKLVRSDTRHSEVIKHLERLDVEKTKLLKEMNERLVQTHIAVNKIQAEVCRRPETGT